jgi:V/A-type H+/Na+-transporting ATPase subunit K
MDKPERQFKQRIIQSIVVLGTVMAMVTTLFCTKTFAAAGGQEAIESEQELTQPAPKSDENVKYGLVAAAIAFGLGAVGAGIAIAHVGAAAMGAIAEKPQMASQALIFVALAEGLVVFGFIMGLMILGKV